jgi:hydrogenase maturation protease
MRTLVIGIGNLLRTDDGVGIHAIHRLHKTHPRIKTLDAAMGSIEIIEGMKGYDRVLIVDAILTGAEPGTIYKVNLTGGEEPPVVTHSHGTDLPTILRLGRQLYPDEMPLEIFLLAVEAEDTTTISDKLTPKVENTMGEVLRVLIKYAG